MAVGLNNAEGERKKRKICRKIHMIMPGLIDPISEPDPFPMESYANGFTNMLYGDEIELSEALLEIYCEITEHPGQPDWHMLWLLVKQNSSD